MSSITFPTVEQVTDLPRHLERRVPKEYEDANGHMNISGYLLLHNEASWPFMASLGIDASYLSERRMSLFDVEHHLRYLGEMNPDDRLAVHGRVVDRTDKLLHGMFFLLDLTKHRLANTFEFVSAHVSLDVRRTVPFPAEVAERLDVAIDSQRELAWDAPLSGALGLRRS